MCTVSSIGDNWNKRWPEQYPWVDPLIQPGQQPPVKWPLEIPPPQVTRQEFDALKKELEELKTLLKAAQKFDEVTNQPHCEHEDKVATLKKIAEMMGVDLEDVFK